MLSNIEILNNGNGPVNGLKKAQEQIILTGNNLVNVEGRSAPISLMDAVTPNGNRLAGDSLILKEFVFEETLDAKLSIQGSDERRLSALILRHKATKIMGKDHLIIGTRGDNRCSIRAIMFGALIEARYLMYTDQYDLAMSVVERIEKGADSLWNELQKLILEPDQFARLRSEFTHKQYEALKLMLNRLKSSKISMSELIWQANSDMHAKLADPEPMNLALTCVGAYLTKVGFDKAFEQEKEGLFIGLSKEAAFGFATEGNDPLKPGANPPAQAERVWLCSELGIRNVDVIARIDSIEDGVNLLLVGDNPPDQYSDFDEDRFRTIGFPATYEPPGFQDKKLLEIMSINTTGHTALVLHESRVKLLHLELADIRLQRLSSLSKYVPNPDLFRQPPSSSLEPQNHNPSPSTQNEPNISSSASEKHLTVKEVNSILNVYRTQWLIWNIYNYFANLLGLWAPHESEEIRALRKLTEGKSEEVELKAVDIETALINKSIFASNRAALFAETKPTKPLKELPKIPSLSTDEVVSQMAMQLNAKT